MVFDGAQNWVNGIWPRLFRNRHNTLIIENSAVPLLMCDNEGVDTTTAKGRHQLAAAVNDAHYEAELSSERVKAALNVAKKRGKKLGTHNPKVKGKGAKATRQQAKNLAKALLKFTKKLAKHGEGPRKICKKLNANPEACAVIGRKFHVSRVQRILSNQRLMKLL